MRLVTILFLSVLIALSASLGIPEPFRLEDETQSIAPELPHKSNPGFNFFLGAELTPVAYNERTPTPGSCIVSTGNLGPIGRFRARRESRDCYHLNLGTGHENGNGNGNANNGASGDRNSNGKHSESDQQDEPGNGAGNNNVPPIIPLDKDPLDECKRYFNLFEYVICDSGESTITPSPDIVQNAYGLLPDQITFILYRCTQGMFLKHRKWALRHDLVMSYYSISDSYTSVQYLPLGKRCMVLR